MKLAAVVTAAGLSSRMGRFKPLLPLGDTTVAGRIVNTFREAGAEDIVFVTGHRGAELMEHLAPMGVRFVHNERYAESQMFDSVKLGLSAVEGRCGAVLFSPVDAPLFSVDTIRAIMSEGSPVVAPIHGGRQGHPVYVESQYISRILAHDGTAGMKGAMEAVGVTLLEVPDHAAMLDADTWEDYQRLLRELEHMEEGAHEPVRP